MQFTTADLVDEHFHQAIIQQQAVANTAIADQRLIGNTYSLGVTVILIHGHINNKVVARLQLYRPITELANTNFRPLQVGQNRHRALLLLGSSTNSLGYGLMVCGAAMGEVKAKYINACAN